MTAMRDTCQVKNERVGLTDGYRRCPRDPRDPRDPRVEVFAARGAPKSENPRGGISALAGILFAGDCRSPGSTPNRVVLRLTRFGPTGSLTHVGRARHRRSEIPGASDVTSYPTSCRAESNPRTAAFRRYPARRHRSQYPVCDRGANGGFPGATRLQEIP